MEVTNLVEKMVEYGYLTNEEIAVANFLCGETLETYTRLLWMKTEFKTAEEFMSKVAEWDMEDTINE